MFLHVTPKMVSDLMRQIERPAPYAAETLDERWCETHRAWAHCGHCPACLAEAQAEDHPEQDARDGHRFRYGLLALASGIAIALIVGVYGP